MVIKKKSLTLVFFWLNALSNVKAGSFRVLLFPFIPCCRNARKGDGTSDSYYRRRAVFYSSADTTALLFDKVKYYEPNSGGTQVGSSKPQLNSIWHHSWKASVSWVCPEIKYAFLSHCVIFLYEYCN